MARPRGPFPSAWIYKDPFDHERHRAFLRQKAQAAFRNEAWDMSVEDFFELWTADLWSRRGRAVDEYCMIRLDTDLPWSKENCKIVIRYESLCSGKKKHKFPSSNEDDLGRQAKNYKQYHWRKYRK